MTYGSSPRYGAAVRLVVLHTAEGARTNAALASFFNGNPNASSHVSIDAGGILDMVPRTLAAWTIGTGNGVTVNGEMCAFARWTRAQWLSESPVDGCANPRQIIRNAAAWARRECAALGIPARVLTIAQVAAGQSGICDHNAYNRAYNAGDHTDVGPGFPWDVFTQDLTGHSATEDDLTPDEHKMLEELQFGTANVRSIGRVGQVIADTGEAVKALNAKVDALAAKVQNISVGGGTVDYDALAERLANKIAQRMES